MRNSNKKIVPPSLPRLPFFGRLREAEREALSWLASLFPLLTSSLWEAWEAWEAIKRKVNKFANIEAIMRQLKLFELEAHLSDMKRKAVGIAGERVAYNMLERAGYEVALTGRGDRRGDLLAIDTSTGERWQIEVKTARRDARGVYQFSLLKDDQHGHTDYRDSDVVILLAVLKSGVCVPFVIPAGAIGSAKSIQFRRHPTAYKGRFAKYLQRGELRLGEAVK